MALAGIIWLGQINVIPFVIILILILILRYKIRNHRRTVMINKFPGPATYPLIGNTNLMFGVHPKDYYQNFCEISKKYLPIFRTWWGPIPMIHICKAEDLEVIMANVNHIDKGFMYSMLDSWLGKGLLTSTGSTWHSHRKLLTPAFHFTILQSFLDVFEQNSRILVSKLNENVGKESFDITPLVSLCTLDIICETAMGVSLNVQRNINSKYVTSVYKLGEILMYRLVHVWLYLTPIFNFSSIGRKYKSNLDVVQGLTRMVISERQKSRKVKNISVEINQGDNLEEKFGLDKKRRLAFLDLLLDAKENGANLTDEDIREEVDTFMFEGHDTTASAAYWTLFMLGHHQEVQNKVVEELNYIFEGTDRSITMQDLNEMKYLEQVIKETLRLFPSVPVIGRYVNKDINIGDLTIPAGTNVLLQLCHVHRDPNVWPNPDQFDPDNFLPERSLGRHPYAYVPFSGGPRNCIGQRFAMMEEKVILSNILRKFKVESVHSLMEVKMVAEMILRPANGIHVKLTPR